MKFSDRSALERTAIDAWIRVTQGAREDAEMRTADDFREVRREAISEGPGDIEKMLRYYGIYQASGNRVSFARYFQVSHPEEHAAILLAEKLTDRLLTARIQLRP